MSAIPFHIYMLLAVVAAIGLVILLLNWNNKRQDKREREIRFEKALEKARSAHVYSGSYSASSSLAQPVSKLAEQQPSQAARDTSSEALVSMAIGAATNSTLAGWLIGGSLTGAAIGDFIRDGSIIETKPYDLGSGGSDPSSDSSSSDF